jgi:cobalt/nickel transport system ATP-binding protein
MIELKDVCYSYKEVDALENINIKIEKGEAVALIGPNGSGKSTLLKLINGIVYPRSGTYTFENKEINEKVLSESKFSKLFHKRIGFVFQNSEAQLFCSSVYEEIAFGPRQLSFEEAEVNKRVKDCMKLLDIESLEKRIPYNLSGGEKKRIAIASVLALNPEVLVLDEPMNGLDPKTKRFLRDLIIKLNSAGKTIICSTHDFEYIKGVFKRVLVFSQNHTIIQDGEYERIVNDEEFLVANNIK